MDQPPVLSPTPILPPLVLSSTNLPLPILSPNFPTEISADNNSEIVFVIPPHKNFEVYVRNEKYFFEKYVPEKTNR